MTFLGCDGAWLLQPDGSTVCTGQLQTFTVEEMRTFLAPALTWEQRSILTGSVLVLLVAVWVIKKLFHTVPH